MKRSKYGPIILGIISVAPDLNDPIMILFAACRGYIVPFKFKRMMELGLNHEKTVPFLVDFLKKTFLGAGFHRAVVGLSGGVDSSLSCVLAARSLGPTNVLALMMPYKDSHPDSLRHAMLLVKKVGVKGIEIDISPQIDAYYARHPNAGFIRRGNKMARERMSILYDYSTTFKGLVVGASNRTEILLGYSTLHGDTACAVNPISGLYKTQVFDLARHLGMPDAIIDKAPTADLWPGQTDEEELGFTYAEVDRLLFHRIDRNATETDLVALGFQKDFVRKVFDRIGRFEFKRALPATIQIPREFLLSC